MPNHSGTEAARITEVAIVGMGAVFPGAADVPAFWRNVCEGVDAITDVPPSRWDPELYFDASAINGHAASDRFYCRRGGFVDDLVDFDPAAYGVMPSAVAGTEPDQLLALRTASEAIADAGGIDRLPDRSRIGVIIGRGGYITPASARMDQRVRTSHQVLSLLRELVPGITAGQLDAVRTAFDDQLGPASPESSIGLVPNFAASRVANRFDFRGPAYTVDAACASSLVAVDHAVRELASGRCDAVLAGAVHHCHVATLWSVFTQLKALSPSQAIRPFDRRADGTLMAEGTGIVLLKRLADAERAGDRVYAVIRGTGLASDGRASSLMSPLVEGQLQAVEQAWREAGLDPTAAGALGLLEAHGTATPTGDQIELETLARAFGRRPAGSDLVGLGTVKSNIGHAMPAAGIAGLIKAALAVHHGVRPPTLHVEEPHPALAETRFRPVTELEPWDRATPATPRRAAVNAFGFGGINAHVVLEEAPGWRPSRRTGDTFPGPGREKRHQFGVSEERVLLLTASTTDEMARLLAVADEELLAEATSSIAVAPAGGPVRLAVVEPTARSLALARKVVARGTPWQGRSDVWFTADPLLAEGSPAGKIAFLFPGFEPEFEPQINDVADHFRLARPTLSGGDELVERSLDIIAVGRLLADALGRLGIVADVMAGHSLGEWTAMIAAGLYSRAAIDEFVATLQPGLLEVPDLVYAALGCGADRAAAAIDGLPDIAVSHDNCPHQSVICGARRSVDVAVERLRADQVMAQPMPFKSGFHSPMLAPYLGPVRESFDRLPIHRPSVPVWSATTVGPFPDDPAAVRDLVVRHLLEPVRFGPLTRRLHAEGVRAFVQVGPGSLPGFVDDTLKDERYLAVTANVASRSGLAQLRRVAAALWTEGRDVRWDRLATSGVVRTTGTRTTVRLDLGTPLVRLNGSAPKILTPGLAVAVAGGDGPGLESPLSRFGGHPVLSGLDAALREATESARRVVSAWQSAPAATVIAPPAPPAPPARSSVERVFSLADLPFVRDHCLLLQPDGWADDSDRFPVVPLTTLLELMADAARTLVPGRIVVGFEQVRALRWLVVAPPTTATVTTVEAGSNRVKVTIEGYSSGVVVMADGWPASPTITEEPLTSERAPTVTARQLYEDRWMFHGPQFAGVDEVTAVADDGIRGVLRPLPAPGALLDSAGQLIGHWMQVGVENDRTVFPVSVDAIRLYGPQPATTDAVACTARVTELTDTGMRADATLRTPDGQVWCRIDGWATRRFATDNIIWRVKMAPEVAGVGESQLGGWCLVRERWPGTASRELMMRRYLNAAERAEYEGLSARRQRHWLLGRIAAKDAVRNWLWQHGHGPVFPCEITVSNDPTGQPRVTGPFAGPLHVSIAHCGDLGVALVSPDGPVGVDVEAIDDRALDTERIGFTAAEHRLLDAESANAGDRTTALVRFWAAKEAVAKARGTGFLGKPRNFEVTGKSGDVLKITTNGDRYHVTTQLIDGPTATYAVAWTATATATAATEGE